MVAKDTVFLRGRKNISACWKLVTPQECEWTIMGDAKIIIRCAVPKDPILNRFQSSCENSRPCALFAGGHCKHGADCSFCHMSHEQRLPKLDKQQRTKLKMLSVAQLLSIILEPLKMKVWQQGIQNEAAEIIEIMELEVAKYPQVQELDTGRVTTQRFRPKKHLSLGTFFLK